MDLLAFLFLCKNPAFLEKRRIFFMAKRQKTQEAVHTLYLLRPSDFSVHYIISLFKK